MATAPEEEATAELKPLTPENDYDPFSDEGIYLGSVQFVRIGAQGYTLGGVLHTG